MVFEEYPCLAPLIYQWTHVNGHPGEILATCLDANPITLKSYMNTTLDRDGAPVPLLGSCGPRIALGLTAFIPCVPRKHSKEYLTGDWLM